VYRVYGMIGRMTAIPGRREELLAALGEGGQDMPGCLSYVIAKDTADADAIWVTEVWDTKDSHDASLSLPGVQAAIARARPLIAGFDSGAETEVVGGIGLGPGTR
jgi:quinol monooxygenase YgiN